MFWHCCANVLRENERQWIIFLTLLSKKGWVKALFFLHTGYLDSAQLRNTGLIFWFSNDFELLLYFLERTSSTVRATCANETIKTIYRYRITDKKTRDDNYWEITNNAYLRASSSMPWHPCRSSCFKKPPHLRLKLCTTWLFTSFWNSKSETRCQLLPSNARTLHARDACAHRHNVMMSRYEKTLKGKGVDKCK